MNGMEWIVQRAVSSDCNLNDKHINWLSLSFTLELNGLSRLGHRVCLCVWSAFASGDTLTNALPHKILHTIIKCTQWTLYSWFAQAYALIMQSFRSIWFHSDHFTSSSLVWLSKQENTSSWWHNIYMVCFDFNNNNNNVNPSHRHRVHIFIHVYITHD